MVDSVKVYIKSKESFGWPEDNEDFPESSTGPKLSSGLPSSNGLVSGEVEGLSSTPMPLTSVDRSVVLLWSI